MLMRFFTDLRAGGVPVTLPEFLALLEALEARLAALSPEDFYYLARMALVKDERHFDRFDRVFAEHFAGAEKVFEKLTAELPGRMAAADHRTPVHRRGKTQGRIASAAGTSCSRPCGNACAEQKEPARGWQQVDRQRRALRPSATRATTPRACASGQDGSRHRRAVKVWDARDYRNLDDARGTRHAQSQDGVAAAAPLRARRCARGTGSRRHHRRHGAQRRPARSQAAARTAQRRQAAAAARRRRLDGSAREGLRRVVLGGARRVQASGIFLLPQLSRTNACGRTTGGASA